MNHTLIFVSAKCPIHWFLCFYKKVEALAIQDSHILLPLHHHLIWWWVCNNSESEMWCMALVGHLTNVWARSPRWSPQGQRLEDERGHRGCYWKLNLKKVGTIRVQDSVTAPFGRNRARTFSSTPMAPHQVVDDAGASFRGTEAMPGHHLGELWLETPWFYSTEGGLSRKDYGRLPTWVSS